MSAPDIGTAADTTSTDRPALVEASFRSVMLLASEHGVLDDTLRQHCLRTLKGLHEGRHKLKQRSRDELVARVQRCVDALTRVLPLDVAPLALPRASGHWDMLLTPPVSRAPKAISARTPSYISAEALNATLQMLDTLQKPMSPAEAYERFTSALTPAPFHRAQSSDATLLVGEGPTAELRAFVTGRVRHGEPAGQIATAWVHEQQGTVTRALRRRIERMVARAASGQPLVDKRRVRRPVMVSCPPLLQALIIKVAYGRPGATNVAIAARVGKELPIWIGRARAAGVHLDVRPPSNLTVARYMARWSPIVTTGREDGVTEALKAFKPNDRYSKATTANSVWQLDNVMLDIMVMIMTKAGPRAVRPWLTTLTDEATGVCVGWVLDTKPITAFSTSRVLYRALTPWRETGRTRCSCPVTLRHDRGRDFLSHHVARVLSLLGITQDVCPPRTPNARPELERFFRSMHMGMSAQPGFVGKGGLTVAQATARPDELLTMDDLVRNLEDWTRDSNCSVHAGQTVTPMQAWERNPGLTVPTDLAWRLLKSDVHRTVQDNGIEFGRGWYRGDLRNPDGLPLTELQQKKVRVYYSPDQPDVIWVTEWIDDPNGREEAYLGMAKAVAAGVPSLNIADSYEGTRSDVQAIASTAKAMTRREDAERQSRTLADAAAPVLAIVEHRAAVATSVAKQQKAERRVHDAHTALLRATPLVFGAADDHGAVASDSGSMGLGEEGWS